VSRQPAIADGNLVAVSLIVAATALPQAKRGNPKHDKKKGRR
jgi:hypothetical protein